MGDGQRPNPKSGPWRSFLLAVTVVCMTVLLAVVHVRLCNYADDDAYIHLRVVRELVRCGVPYYNPDEPAKVSSSTGWVLLLAMMSLTSRSLGVEVVPLAWIAAFNAVATMGGALTYANLLRRVARASSAMAVVLGVSYVAILVPASLGLMETPLALLLVGLGLSLAFQGRHAGLALIAVSAFVRPELVVVLGLVGAYLAWGQRTHLVRLAAFPIVAVAPFAAFDLYFYRTVVPAAIRAKALLYDLEWDWVLEVTARRILPPVALRHPRIDYYLGSTGTIAVVAALLTLAGGGVLGLLLKARADKALPRASAVALVAWLWTGVLVAVYVASRTWVFVWYGPLFAVPMALSASLCFALIRRPWYRLALWAVSVPVLVAYLLSLGQTSVAALSGDPALYPGFSMGARTRQYLAVGRALYAQYPGATLMSSEIGALGYGFEGTVYDAAGLASPDASRYHPMRVPEDRSAGWMGAIPVALVEEVNPDLIVTYDVFGEAVLRNTLMTRYVHLRLPVFMEDDLARGRDVGPWGAKHLNLLVRNDVVRTE